MTSQLHRSNSLPFFPANSPPSLDLRTPLSFSNTSTPKRAASPASSAGSHVSGVSHPPGSRKRRRLTIVKDVSSDELLSSIDKWDDGFTLESSSSTSGVRSHSQGRVIVYNYPFRDNARLACTPPDQEDVPRKMSVPPSYMSPMTAPSPPPSYPTPTEPVAPTLASINQTRLESTGAIGSYKCTHPGCTAAPFQAQYILNSHANIHLQDRSHFCPVDGCPRALGGKGFKRKNEMIRHSLVHDLPGYICPFCPDQQHKYPQPDNLQRHVRAHHVDKSKDDPILHEVLAQRPIRSPGGRLRRSYIQRVSWSCNNISDISAAFHFSHSLFNHKTSPKYDWCGYCGENFPNSPAPCWYLRVEHLMKVHKFGECSSMKSFSSVDHFHAHIRHAHNGLTGAWSDILGNACKREESIHLPPDQNEAPSAVVSRGHPRPQSWHPFGPEESAVVISSSSLKRPAASKLEEARTHLSALTDEGNTSDEEPMLSDLIRLRDGLAELVATMKRSQACS